MKYAIGHFEIREDQFGEAWKIKTPPFGEEFLLKYPVVELPEP